MLVKILLSSMCLCVRFYLDEDGGVTGKKTDVVCQSYFVPISCYLPSPLTLAVTTYLTSDRGTTCCWGALHCRDTELLVWAEDVLCLLSNFVNQ